MLVPGLRKSPLPLFLPLPSLPLSPSLSLSLPPSLPPLLSLLLLTLFSALTKFFVDVRHRLPRDYIVIMDMSGSMMGM